MKILITGVNSFLGGELRWQLERTKHVAISFARKKEGLGDIYMDGQSSNYQDGNEAIDQITAVSQSLPEVKSFRAALEKYR